MKKPLGGPAGASSFDGRLAGIVTNFRADGPQLCASAAPLVPVGFSRHVSRMGRTGTARTFLLLAFAEVGCSREPPGSVPQRPNLPLFAVADSTVLGMPEGLARSGTLIGAYALNDSMIAVVGTGPGAVALVDRHGTPQVGGSPHNLRNAKPAHVALCTQGGIVIITDVDRRAIALDSLATVSDGWRIPLSLGPIRGVQCESARDLVALVDAVLPATSGAALVRVATALVHLSNAGQRVDTLGSFPGHEVVRFTTSDPGSDPPFGIATRFAAGPTRLYLANTNEATIQEFQTNGRRLGSIDIVGDTKRVSRAQIDSAFRARYGPSLSRLPKDVVQGLLDAVARDRTEPGWRAFAVDPDENVWVTGNEPPDQDGDRAWVVYTAGGSRRAKVFLPHDFEVTEVGRTYVLGFLRSAPPARAARRYGLLLLGG